MKKVDKGRIEAQRSNKSLKKKYIELNSLGCVFCLFVFKPFLHQFKDSQYIKGKTELS